MFNGGGLIMLIRKISVFLLRSDLVSTYDRMRDMREFRGGREEKIGQQLVG